MIDTLLAYSQSQDVLENILNLFHPSASGCKPQDFPAAQVSEWQRRNKGQCRSQTPPGTTLSRFEKKHLPSISFIQRYPHTLYFIASDGFCTYLFEQTQVSLMTIANLEYSQLIVKTVSPLRLLFFSGAIQLIA